MLTNEFISLCKEYAKGRGDVLNEVIEDDKKLCRYVIELYGLVLEFRYIKKESVFYKPSSLYCVIGLRKNSVVYYHLPDIIPFLEQKTLKSPYFWAIENEERLKNCFDSLILTLEAVLSQIDPFLQDDTKLFEGLIESYKIVYGLKEGDIDFSKIDDPNEYDMKFFLSLQNNRDGFLFSRYSNFAPYALVLRNNYDKAVAKYEKLALKGKLLAYEKFLLESIKNPEIKELDIFDEECNTINSEKDFMKFSSFLKAFLLVFVVASVFFCGIFALCNFILQKNCEILLAAPWYLGSLCAGLCSVFGSIAFFSYMPRKEMTKAQLKDLSSIMISKGVKKASVIVFVLSVAVSVFFAVMMLVSNVRFCEETVKFESKEYSYTQIDSVYRINARYNEYGDRIERASYVILFKDKTSLDLDGSTSVEYTEKEVLPFLEKKGFKPQNADSEKDLPWYS